MMGRRKTEGYVQFKQYDLASIEKLAKQGLSLKSVCHQLGYNYKLWYHHARLGNEDHVNAYERGLSYHEHALKQMLLKNAMEGDTKAAAFLLAAVHGITDKPNVHMNVQVNNQHNTLAAKEAEELESPEDRKKRLQTLIAQYRDRRTRFVSHRRLLKLKEAK